MYTGIIKACINEANKSTYKVKVGAIVFKGKKILGRGHNGLRSSNINNKYKDYINSLHAEQSALLNLDWNNLKGYSILVLRVSDTGKLCSSRPCLMCSKLLKHVGIQNIYYSTSSGEIIKEKL